MGNAVSLVSAYRNAKPAFSITRRIIEVIQERSQVTTTTDSDNLDRATKNNALTLDGIKELIKHENLASAEILGNDTKLTELAKTALYQVKLQGKISQGFFGSPERNKEIFHKISELSGQYNRELYKLFINLKANGKDFSNIAETEEFKTLLPKLAEVSKSWITLNKEVGEQLLGELFSGDYKSFKDAITPIFGGVVPHEDLIQSLFNALNKEGNEEKIEKVKEKIQTILKTEIPEATPDDVSSVETAANKSEELIAQVGEIVHEIFGSKDDVTTIDGTTTDLELNPGLLTHFEKIKLLGLLERALLTEAKAVGEVITGFKDSDFAKKYPLISCILHGGDPERSIPLGKNEFKLSRMEARLDKLRATSEAERKEDHDATIAILESRKLFYTKRKDEILDNSRKKGLEQIHEAAVKKLAACKPEETPISLCFLAGIDGETRTQIFHTFEQINKNLAEINEIKAKTLRKGDTQETQDGVPFYNVSPEQSDRWATLEKENDGLAGELLLRICNNAQVTAKKQIEQIETPTDIPVSLELLAKTDPKRVGDALLTLLRSGNLEDPKISNLLPLLTEVAPVAYDLIDTITDNPKIKEVIEASLPVISPIINTQLEKFGYELHRIEDSVPAPVVISETATNAQENIGKTFTELLKGFDTTILDNLETSLSGLQGAVIGMALKAVGLNKKDLLELSKTLRAAITASNDSTSDLSATHKQVGSQITSLLSRVDIGTLNKLEGFLGHEKVKAILGEGDSLQAVKTILINLKTVKAELNKTASNTATGTDSASNTPAQKEKTTFQKVAPIVVTAVGGLGLLGGIFMSSFEGLTRSIISGIGAIIGTLGLLSWFPNLTNFLNGENTK